MIQATQLKRGMCIKHDNDLWRVVEAQHKTPGNLRGLVQARIRNLKNGAISDETEMEFLYRDGDMYHFMNNETYEQIGLSDEVLGDAVPYLIPNIKLKIEMWEGRPVGIELPMMVEMKVLETTAAIKGASVSNQNKPAKMETGLVVNVPPFIAEGDVIRIDTSSGSYIERARS